MRAAASVLACMWLDCDAYPASDPHTQDGMRLIELNESARVWMTPQQVDDLAQNSKGGFMDITDHVSFYTAREMEHTNRTARLPPTAFPTSLSHQDYVDSILPTLSASNIEKSISTLSAYRTRYYTTDTAVQAVNWLMQQYKDAAGNRLGVDVSIELFMHTWEQPSLIVAIEGSDSSVSPSTVIIGSHMDSINNGAAGVAPGADDDASGSSTNLEIFRGLMANNFKPDRTVEFHAYAAEEVGLRGSQAVAERYQRVGRNVYSMMQLDMDCWPYPKVDGQEEIGLIADYTSANMNAFLKLVIKEYCTIGVEDSLCGYGCSDHASWNRLGWDAAFPFEAVFEHRNPYIHTAQDTLANCDIQHALQYARLGVGYIVETSVLP